MKEKKQFSSQDSLKIHSNISDLLQQIYPLLFDLQSTFISKNKKSPKQKKLRKTFCTIVKHFSGMRDQLNKIVFYQNPTFCADVYFRWGDGSAGICDCCKQKVRTRYSHLCFGKKDYHLQICLKCFKGEYNQYCTDCFKKEET